MLRASGLGYTIVRPGPLQEEPGGYKALVFDQGNRISHAISCADVADVTLKASHVLCTCSIAACACEWRCAGGLLECCRAAPLCMHLGCQPA